MVHGAHRPLGFFSRKLPAEMRYAAFDRELLATHDTIKHFQPLLEARLFQLWTDHKPLVAALASSTTPTPAPRQRQMAFISEHTSDIIHKPGIENVVADLLSRPCEPNSTRQLAVPAHVPPGTPGPTCSPGPPGPPGSVCAATIPPPLKLTQFLRNGRTTNFV